MKNLREAALALALLSPMFAAHAAPMDPASRPAPGSFDADTIRDFTLFADSDDSKLVFWIPRHGTVAVDNQNTPSPFPHFAISDYTATSGIYTGSSIATFGGIFSSTGVGHSLQHLIDQATAQGLHAAPAPIETAQSKFIVVGAVTTNGSLDVQCTSSTESVTINGVTKTFQQPHCKAKKTPESPAYDLDMNIMQNYAWLAPLNNSDAAQDIPFQGTSTDSGDAALHNLMNGSQWPYLQGALDWNVKVSERTRQARLTVHWDVLFEQLSSDVHYSGLFTSVDLKAFWQKVIDCRPNAPCAVKVEYMNDDGSYSPVAPADPDFLEVVQRVEDELNTQLFDQIKAANISVLGTASGGGFFSVRANYEKRMTSGDEVHFIQFNPGAQHFSAQTALDLECLTGGFGAPVGWAMNNAACKTLLQN